MEHLLSQFGITLLIGTASIAFLAGVIKGIVGFAMPMVFISGLTFFVSPDVALGILILPTLITNVWQSLRSGFGAVANTIRNHKVFLTVVLVVLLGTTQLVPLLPLSWFFAVLGTVVIAFAFLMLTGWMPKGRTQSWIDWGCAVTAGLSGGLAGVWGPPTVVYLTSKSLSKSETMQIQGVIYGSGALFLTAGHWASGVFNATTASIGLLMVFPALAGIWVGFLVQDRINQATFKNAMLIILILAGANLLRRALL